MATSPSFGAANRRRFPEEPLARDGASLDLFRLEDEAMADLENLPEPDEPAAEIVERLRAATASFRAATV